MGKKLGKNLNKKRSQLSGDPPCFADLYRMYEELLRLRREVEDEEIRAHLTAPTAEPNKDGTARR